MELEGKIILTRHLATINNRSGIIMGRSINVDILKDSQVERFKHKVGDFAKKHNITATNSNIISSPLVRCVSTASIINNILHKNDPIRIQKNLIETDMGSFEGKTGKQLRISHPNLLNQWMYNPENFQFPNGESYIQVSERVDRVMKSLVKMKFTQFLFVCTHVDIIKMFLLKIQNKKFNERRSIEIPNGNITLLSTNPSKVSFEIINTNWNN